MDLPMKGHHEFSKNHVLILTGRAVGYFTTISLGSLASRPHLLFAMSGLLIFGMRSERSTLGNLDIGYLDCPCETKKFLLTKH